MSAQGRRPVRPAAVLAVLVLLADQPAFVAPTGTHDIVPACDERDIPLAGTHDHAASAAPAPAPTSVHVTVTATGGWVDTGLDVSPADNFFNLTDLGVCADCAPTKYGHWGMLISYTGSSPPGVGSYVSKAVAERARLIDGVGSHLDGNWPYTGELWLAFNDDAYSGTTSDNFGEVTATITVTHA